MTELNVLTEAAMKEPMTEETRNMRERARWQMGYLTGKKVSYQKMIDYIKHDLEFYNAGDVLAEKYYNQIIKLLESKMQK